MSAAAAGAYYAPTPPSLPPSSSQQPQQRPQPTRPHTAAPAGAGHVSARLPAHVPSAAQGLAGGAAHVPGSVSGGASARPHADGSLSGRPKARALALFKVDKEVAREVAAMRQLMRRQEALLPMMMEGGSRIGGLL